MSKKIELVLLEELLHRHNVSFLYFGSYALKILYEKELTDFQPPDIDILICASYQNILDLLFSLENSQWKSYVWNESFLPTWTINHLKGKWYVRIKKGRLLCDLSFEYPYLDIVRAMQRGITWQSHSMCCLEDIWFLKLLKDEERTREFAQRYQLVIPERSFIRCSTWKREKRC